MHFSRAISDHLESQDRGRLLFVQFGLLHMIHRSGCQGLAIIYCKYRQCVTMQVHYGEVSDNEPTVYTFMYVEYNMYNYASEVFSL